MNARSLAGVVLALLSSSVYAGGAVRLPVPEPGVLELLGIGVVAVIIAAIRKRPKK